MEAVTRVTEAYEVSGRTGERIIHFTGERPAFDDSSPWVFALRCRVCATTVRYLPEDPLRGICEHTPVETRWNWRLARTVLVPGEHGQVLAENSEDHWFASSDSLF